MAEKVVAKVEEKVEEKAEVKVVAAKPITVKEKYVKVKSKFTGSRYIGGTWYDFEKDKEVEVTEDAKRSLLEAGAIYL